MGKEGEEVSRQREREGERETGRLVQEVSRTAADCRPTRRELRGTHRLFLIGISSSW